MSSDGVIEEQVNIQEAQRKELREDALGRANLLALTGELRTNS